MKYEKGSFLVVPNKKTLQGLDVHAQVVYLWLCDFADENGECFPSRSTLAEKGNISLSSVDKALSILEKSELIVKFKRFHEQAPTSNMYQLKIVLGGSISGKLPTLSQTLGVASETRTNSIHILTQSNELTYVLEEKPKNERTNLFDFESFWSIFPKKRNKQQASAEWRKLTKEEREAAFEDVPKRSKSKEWTDIQYVPMPSNYLRDKRWQDEIIKSKKIPIYG